LLNSGDNSPLFLRAKICKAQIAVVLMTFFQAALVIKLKTMSENVYDD